MKNRKIYGALGILLAITGLTGCMSTESIEPDMEGADGNKIVINLSSEDLGTRATADHTGYKLRYVVKLFKSTLNNASDEPLYRKELIEGETGNNNVQNQLVFEVEAGTYSLFVFADYIPESYTLNGESYGDYFYNTQYGPTSVRMLGEPKKINSYKYSAEFFNNDNYDCFGMRKQVTKTSKNLVVDEKLKRLVAKVVYEDQSNNIGTYKITGSRLGVYQELGMKNNMAMTIPSDTDSESKLNDLEISSAKKINSVSGKEVVYFYSFASEESAKQEENVFFTFKTTPSSGTEKNCATKGIKIKRNYVTRVTGNFLNEDTGNSGGGGTDFPPTDEDGPLYIYLGIDTEDWNSQSSSWGE